MKSTLIFCFLTLCATTFFAQTTPTLAQSLAEQNTGTKSTPSVSAEEEALKKVVTAETEGYCKRDFAVWANSYVDAPTTSSMLTPNGPYASLAGTTDFQKMSKGMKAWMAASPQSEMQVTKCDNWVSRVNGNMAWIMYDQFNVMTKTGTKMKSRELRVLEKVNGEWKISSSSSIWDFKNAELPTPNPEDEEIKQLIIGENEAFSAGNIDAFMDCYAQVPYLLWTVTNGMEPGDVLTFRGYDALKAFAQGLPWFKNYKPNPNATPKPNNGMTKDNWNIQFRGNVALVTFDEHWKNEEKKTNVDLTVTKTLEKINGKWKLIITSALADFKDATPPIRTKY